MINKNFWIGIIIIIIFIGSFIIHPIIKAQDKGQESYIFEAKPGNVTFTHWKHQDELKIDCMSCHHKTEAGATPKACTTCHKIGVTTVPEGEPPTMKDAAHHLCRGCHKEKAAAGEKAPTKCLECHIKNE